MAEDTPDEPQLIAHDALTSMLVKVDGEPPEISAIEDRITEAERVLQHIRDAIAGGDYGGPGLLDSETNKAVRTTLNAMLATHASQCW